MNKGSEDFQFELLPIDSNANPDLCFKIVLVGEAGVGKSCISMKGATNKFNQDYSTTVGFEYSWINYQVNDKIIRLQIWDTCGQEIYQSLVTNFFRSSALAFLVYSITDRDSFSHLDSWLRDLRIHSSSDIQIFLLGNKVDVEMNRTVLYEEGMKFKAKHNLDLFMETSAKSGYNINELFLNAARLVYTQYLRYQSLDSSPKYSQSSQQSLKLSSRKGNNGKEANGSTNYGCFC